MVFEYPRIYEASPALDVIRLEIGPLAAWSPTEHATVTPYLADSGIMTLQDKSTTVRVAVARRTFWEKVTILHQEAHRPKSKRMPQRYSRHYYDLYRLASSPVRSEALADIELLADVVAFKDRFYRMPWARTPEAMPGTLRLRLPEWRRPELEVDYRGMRSMLFGDVPTLDEIQAGIAELEDEVNGLA